RLRPAKACTGVRLRLSWRNDPTETALELPETMHSVPESKKSHLWRKIVWHTDPEVSPLGPYHSIEVYCCEEANGYAVWYVRKLGKDDGRGMSGMENGDYLLRYFPA